MQVPRGLRHYTCAITHTKSSRKGLCLILIDERRLHCPALLQFSMSVFVSSITANFPSVGRNRSGSWTCHLYGLKTEIRGSLVDNGTQIEGYKYQNAAAIPAKARSYLEILCSFEQMCAQSLPRTRSNWAVIIGHMLFPMPSHYTHVAKVWKKCLTEKQEQ